jgi:hypothetical protein
VIVRNITQAMTIDGVLAIPVLSVVALIVAQLSGAWFVQLAYASGPPDLVVACQTVLNPMVAVGIGASVLGETTGIGSSLTTMLALCGAVAVFGIVLLARSRPDLVGTPAQGALTS